MITWRTKEGEVIPLEEMSDTHLKHAINYTKSAYAAGLLQQEQERRREVKFKQQLQECPYCAAQMGLHELETQEVGWSLPTYQFICTFCEARSPTYKREGETLTLKN